MSIKYKGELEVDFERGVIYFHASNHRVQQQYGSITVLRICKLPKPIPTDRQLDITHMTGASWGRNDEDAE